MPIRFETYQPEHIPAALAFNERLQASSPRKEFGVAEAPVAGRFAPGSGHSVWEDYYLAFDGEDVRGGYILRRLPFLVRGEEREIGFLYAPVTEGLWDKRYAMAAVQLLRDAVRRSPELFCLGMGGWNNPLPKMLQAMKWRFRLVPFRFRVCRAGRFLREIRPLRTSPLRRLAADIGAMTGTGALAIGAMQRWKKRSAGACEAVEVPEFGDWADDVWRQGREGYAFTQVRSRDVLSLLYPVEDARFLRLRVRRDGRDLGWMVCFDTAMRDDQYFGNLRLGTLIDGFAKPEDASAVIQAAADFLQNRGVDLIVSNQAHQAWVAGLEAAGFLEGPSNFLFGGSRALASALEPFEASLDRAHLNRGDGDGPIHL
ncbi:MAG: hypothetical protein GC160_28310 [Acidobacteria bacterium]|nr:hypothetical protein [Acidobacteriota bacterium]